MSSTAWTESRINDDAWAVCQFRQTLIIQPFGMLGSAAAAAIGDGDDDDLTTSAGAQASGIFHGETIFDQEALPAVSAAYPPEESLQRFYDSKQPYNSVYTGRVETVVFITRRLSLFPFSLLSTSDS